jgi:alkylhydroperoxidase family enzyme
MRHVSYYPDTGTQNTVADAIRKRRGGQLLNLDRMLLHSQAFAKGWNVFLGEVRNGLELPSKLRELAICLVAVLNRAEYEFLHHAPEFLKAGGTEEQLDAIRRIDYGRGLTVMFDETEMAVIELTVVMTNCIQVSEPVMREAKLRLKSEQLVVELVGVIAAYNMVSRFLVALDVEPER